VVHTYVSGVVGNSGVLIVARVIVIASYAPSLIIFREHLLGRLVELGHDVIACAPDADASICDRLKSMGITYRDVQLSRTGQSPFADILYLIRLFRLLRSDQPDVVLSYTIKPVIFGSIAARMAGIGRIYALMTGLGFAFESTQGRVSLGRSLARVLLKLAFVGVDKVIVQNTDDGDELLREGIVSDSRQIALVNGSGVDLQRFAMCPIPVDQVVFLLIARLLKAKGVRDFASAAKIVKKDNSGVRFVLAGWFDNANPGGISRDEVNAWEEQGTIEYVGRLGDVRDWLSRTTVYVLPSYYREGTPRTVLEAMAMGRPVITADTPGCRQTVVHGENGYLVPPANPVALAEAMMQFVRNPSSAIEMGGAGRKMAEQKYDVRDVSENMLRIMRLT
jgi:glycosyltransferase involved in cell wall biosynthesis